MGLQDFMNQYEQLIKESSEAKSFLEYAKSQKLILETTIQQLKSQVQDLIVKKEKLITETEEEIRVKKENFDRIIANENATLAQKSKETCELNEKIKSIEPEIVRKNNELTVLVADAKKKDEALDFAMGKNELLKKELAQEKEGLVLLGQRLAEQNNIQNDKEISLNIWQKSNEKTITEIQQSFAELSREKELNAEEKKKLMAWQATLEKKEENLNARQRKIEEDEARVDFKGQVSDKRDKNLNDKEKNLNNEHQELALQWAQLRKEQQELAFELAKNKK